MKKAIITGSTSFIGVALSKLLLENQYIVYAIVRPGSLGIVNLPSHKNLVVVNSELKDLDKITLDEIGKCEVLFHIGWNSDFADSRYNFDGQMDNVEFTLKAVTLAINSGCNTFIGIGSQAECGRIYDKIDCNTPEKPETAYAYAKCKAAKESKRLCEKNGIKHIWPRVLSAYGKFDKSHTLIMKCINACKNKEKIDLTLCEQIWDFIHVDDVAMALFLIYQKGIHGKKYPIGSGNGRKLKEYINQIAMILDYEDLIKGIGKKDYSKDQVMYLCSDNFELNKDTGFLPRVEFKQGIIEIVNNHS